MRIAPKPRSDGKCVECGKPKKRSRRAANGANKAVTNYTRQDRKMWLIHLEHDPWCSRECLERWYRISKGPKEKVCARAQCVNTFTPQPNQTGHRFCSQNCREKARRSASRSDVPGKCRGCGGDRDEFTKGCYQCSDRRRSRRRRECPEYREMDRLRKLEWNRGRREQRLKEAA